MYNSKETYVSVAGFVVGVLLQVVLILAFAL